MLYGKHVGLRAIKESDLSQLLFWRNQPHFRQYFREHRELSTAHQARWFEGLIDSSTTYMFAIEKLADGDLIGACGLCYINWINRSADFSIYIGVENLYIDDNFAPDAAQVMIKYGFNQLGLHRLWSEIYEFDKSKIVFFEQLGFSLEGNHRETYWNEGKWHNSLFYGLLCAEYQFK